MHTFKYKGNTSNTSNYFHNLYINRFYIGSIVKYYYSLYFSKVIEKLPLNYFRSMHVRKMLY